MWCLANRFFKSILHAYGFEKTSTIYLKNYLSYQKQKIKANKAFSNSTKYTTWSTTGLYTGSITLYCFSLMRL